MNPRALESTLASNDDVSSASDRHFLGDSASARAIDERIRRLAASHVNVLIEGETGVGKMLAARLIHETSARSREPLRIIPCASLSEDILERELSWRVRGAFPGARGSRGGLLAGRGTLVLQGIAELSTSQQAKLLGALEEDCVEQGNSDERVAARARVVCISHRNLDPRVSNARFREDLFYRIAVVRLRIPPLRERASDIAVLARHFLARASHRAGRTMTGFNPDALALLERYPWPGNVRELENVVAHAVSFGDGPVVHASHLPGILHGTEADGDGASVVALPRALDELERLAIDAALRATDGNCVQAARLLGISRTCLYDKLKRPKRTSNGKGDLSTG